MMRELRLVAIHQRLSMEATIVCMISLLLLLPCQGRPQTRDGIEEEEEKDRHSFFNRLQFKRQFSAAVKPDIFYVRPIFDDQGRPLILSKSNVADKRNPRRPKATKASASKSAPRSDPEHALPVFGQPDVVLQNTARLRSLDSEQHQFISTQGDHAGILPLAFEDPGALNLFPPLRPAKRLP